MMPFFAVEEVRSLSVSMGNGSAESEWLRWKSVDKET